MPKDKLKEKIIDILVEYPSHPPMMGTEKGINLVTVDKILDLFDQVQKKERKELEEKIKILANTIYYKGVKDCDNDKEDFDRVDIKPLLKLFDQVREETKKEITEKFKNSFCYDSEYGLTWKIGERKGNNVNLEEVKEIIKKIDNINNHISKNK